MIVTHEMAFARAFCNRVFYTNEGRVYEDGTPDQVFDRPVREKTRRFVRRLKVLELLIDSREYDFPGMINEIENYCRKNMIGAKTSNNIHHVFEEVVQQMLLPTLAEPHIQVVLEYSEALEHATMTVRANGPRVVDIEHIHNQLSLALVKAYVSTASNEDTDSEQYTNQFVLEIR